MSYEYPDHPKSFNFYASSLGRVPVQCYGLLDDEEYCTGIHIEFNRGEEYAKWVADALHAMRGISDPAAFVAAAREIEEAGK